MAIAWVCSDYTISHIGVNVWRITGECVEVSPYDLLQVSDPVELFELSNWSIDSPNETLYLCAIEGGASFYGQHYEGIPMSSEGWDLVGHGTPPTPKLVLSNLGQYVSEWLYQATRPGYRLEGAVVKRRLTTKRQLDGEVGEDDAIREQPHHLFVVEQVSETRRQVEVVLVDPLSRVGVTVPNRVAGRRCPWIYRDAATCGYAGTAGWDLNGNAVLSRDRDVCAKTVAACQLRFGVWASLPHGGFPGMQTY
jgi:lambda family phage minor tail protein L